MPLPGHEPFLRAICADPEDDTVRLVFADWLDENGDPDRAEFIRIQVEHVRGADWATRSKGVIPQGAAQLWLRNRRAWIRELPQIRDVNWSGWDRGFRHQVGVNLGPALFDHADELFAAVPVQAITAHGAGDEYVERLVGLPRLEQIRELGFVSCQLGGTSRRRLATCRRLTGLRQLVVCLTMPLPRDEAARAWAGRVVLTESDAAALAESPVLTSLEAVIVRGFLDPTVAAILESRFRKVEHGLR